MRPMTEAKEAELRAEKWLFEADVTKPSRSQPLSPFGAKQSSVGCFWGRQKTIVLFLK